MPFDSTVTEIVDSKRARRVRYRSTSPEAEGGWTSTIDIEVDLLPVPTSVDEVSALETIQVTSPTAAELDPVVRQTHRRSWYVMCPDR